MIQIFRRKRRKRREFVVSSSMAIQWPILSRLNKRKLQF